LQSHYGACTGISFIDSTSLSVCDPKRIPQHRVFAAEASRGKSSMGWFFGFKLHLAVNDQGELLACSLTPGNVDDRALAPRMVQRLCGNLIGDRGSIAAPLTALLFEQGLHEVTRLRTNMKHRLMHLSDKFLVRKRAVIESIIDQLKNSSLTRALASSQPDQLCRPFDCWASRLQSSSKKARPSSRSTLASSCLIGLAYPELTLYIHAFSFSSSLSK
jgi:DDE family transposase